MGVSAGRCTPAFVTLFPAELAQIIIYSILPECRMNGDIAILICVLNAEVLSRVLGMMINCLREQY